MSDAPRESVRNATMTDRGQISLEREFELETGRITGGNGRKQISSIAHRRYTFYILSRKHR